MYRPQVIQQRDVAVDWLWHTWSSWDILHHPRTSILKPTKIKHLIIIPVNLLSQSWIFFLFNFFPLKHHAVRWYRTWFMNHEKVWIPLKDWCVIFIMQDSIKTLIFPLQLKTFNGWMSILENFYRRQISMKQALKEC